MKFFNATRERFIDIYTLAWFDRLQLKHPRLATAVGGFAVVLACGLFAWYYLDPRIIIYAKGSPVLLDRTTRVIVGVISGGGSLIVAIVTICIIVNYSDPVPTTPVTPTPTEPTNIGPSASKHRKAPLPPRSARSRKRRSR
jgi:hypothetical protein